MRWSVYSRNACCSSPFAGGLASRGPTMAKRSRAQRCLSRVLLMSNVILANQPGVHTSSEQSYPRLKSPLVPKHSHASTARRIGAAEGPES